MSLHFLKSLLTTTILTLTVVPIFFLIANNDMQWITVATLIWSSSTFLIFYPSIRYIYPHLISKVGLYLLSVILIIISAWFNIITLQLLLSYDYIYYALFNTSFTNVTLVGTIYLIINVIILNLILHSNIEFYEEERLF